MNSSSGLNIVVNRASQYLVFAYQAIVILAFLALPAAPRLPVAK